MDRRRVEKFLGYIKEFEFTDLLAFGKILGIEENENFQEYVMQITIAFNEANREHRKALLKLAKDIAAENKEKQILLKEEAENNVVK